MNLFSAIEASLLRQPERIVIETAEHRWSARALLGKVEVLDARLRASGVVADDRVVVQVEKSVEALALYLACLREGTVFVPLNTAYGASEVDYFLRDAEPRAFICDPRRHDEAAALCQDAGIPKLLTLAADGSGSLTADLPIAATAIATTDRADDQLAAICYTSGTTGRSKGAMISHANLLSNACTLIELWGFSDRDVLLHMLPIYHIHGLFVAAHCALLSGAKMLFRPRFDAQTALADLRRATVMMGVPTFYTRLLQEPTLDADAVKSLRLFISGSAPLLPETFEQFAERTGHRILERYGMTETGMIASNRLDRPRRAGSVGWGLPGVELRVADGEGQPLARGETGTVEVRGPNVFKGYWRMPEKTALEFRRNGWFITGDLGRIESDGSLSLVGRGKDLIISGGLNVYPKEIELLLDTMEDIEESAVIGVPHADFGEAVVAVLILKRGSTLDETATITALRKNLAAFKTPKRLLVVDELPRNAMGKVQKNLLRQRFALMFQSA
jgi:malonyl-CoA/methylmalonyl-CoA synthetase